MTYAKHPLPIRGEQARPFVVETLEGHVLSSKDLPPHARALVFFSTNCRHCVEKLPLYNITTRLAREHGVEIVLVSVDPPEMTRDWVREAHPEASVWIAPRTTNSFLDDYGLPGVPAFCLVDADGNCVVAGVPSFDGGDWTDLLRSWGFDPVRGALAAAEGRI